MTDTLVPEPPLTPREVEVVELVSQGMTNREIANELGIAVDTVKEHVNNVLHKKRMKNRVQLAVWHHLSTPPKPNAHPEHCDQLAQFAETLSEPDRISFYTSFARYCASEVHPRGFSQFMEIMRPIYRPKPQHAA